MDDIEKDVCIVARRRCEDGCKGVGIARLAARGMRMRLKAKSEARMVVRECSA